jgi:hypothetical protein
MASKEWDDARAEVTRKAKEAVVDIKRQAAIFVADHPEIEEAMNKVEAEASKRIKTILDRLK